MKKLLLIVSVLVMCLIPMVSHAQAASGVLTWTQNVETDLAGYKIYRSNQSCTASGPLAPLVVGGIAVQVGKVGTYTDANLPAMDGTMCWEITAFDLSGNESLRSNRVSKVLNTLPPVPPVGLNVAIQ